MTGPIAVVAPLPEEIGPLVRRLAQRRKVRWGGRRWIQGRLAGEEVVVGVAGDGASRAAAAAAALLDDCPVAALLVIGLAGALDPDLERGTLVAAERVLNEEGPVPPPDASWLALALGLPSVHPATLLSVSALVASPEEKASLRQRIPVASCVDLESASLAHAAASRHVPYLVLRAVMDAADEALPPFLAALADVEGHVSRARVVGAALRRPSRLTLLRTLARRARVESRRLAHAVESLLSRRREGVDDAT